jgi:hypothetical protein
MHHPAITGQYSTKDSLLQEQSTIILIRPSDTQKNSNNVHRTPNEAGLKADAEAIVQAIRAAATFMVTDGVVVDQYIDKTDDGEIAVWLLMATMMTYSEW